MNDEIPVTNGGGGIGAVVNSPPKYVAGPETEPIRPTLQLRRSPIIPTIPLVGSDMSDGDAYICFYICDQVPKQDSNCIAYVSDSIEEINHIVLSSQVSHNSGKTRKFEDTRAANLDPRFALELSVEIKDYNYEGEMIGNVYVHRLPNLNPKDVTQVQTIIDKL